MCKSIVTAICYNSIYNVFAPSSYFSLHYSLRMRPASPSSWWTWTCVYKRCANQEAVPTSSVYPTNRTTSTPTEHRLWALGRRWLRTVVVGRQISLCPWSVLPTTASTVDSVSKMNGKMWGELWCLCVLYTHKIWKGLYHSFSVSPLSIVWSMCRCLSKYK